MGTQQILMIVLSVIIVGVAVSVGIQMFNTQRDSSTTQAIAADLQNFGANLVAFAQTPASMGGAEGASSAPAATSAAAWLGWSGDTETNNNAAYKLTSTDFEYTITASGANIANGSTVVVDASAASPTPVVTINNN